ncbi:5'-nucleotidase [Bradyrhizobium sp. Pear76]|nr:5'-nucleotidase [Bradyrhizobium oropedii]
MSSSLKSINHYGFVVKIGSFTSGRSLSPFVPARGIDLFLSHADADVRSCCWRCGSSTIRRGA